jgi:hypothetical protein
MDQTERPSRTPDQDAAHELLSELRTRIALQPLPYQLGVEARALQSLREVFDVARAAMKNHPGCQEFARRATHMLNLDLRPVTAKWHRALSEGRLASRDGANEFRADLESVQQKLRVFASELHEMAYGSPHEDELTPFPLDQAAVEACLNDLLFGIPKGALMNNDAIIDVINEMEGEAIEARRAHYGFTRNRMNATGFSLSGGGIRSSTFCLGVSQVLAARGLLEDIDYLSTVSGGGYVGCFLTMRLTSKGAHENVAAPHGPDPEAIRYLRLHARYLAASNLKDQWSMVTATFAGMLLNWTAPLFLIALAALFAVGVNNISSGWPVPWQVILLASGAVTAVCVLIYALSLRHSGRIGGWLLAAAAALTLLVASLWLLSFAYTYTFGMTLRWQMIGTFLAAAVTGFPAVVRFIPVFRKPAIRRLILKTALTAAGLIIPIGAMVLSFAFYHLGTLPKVDIEPDTWSLLHYVSGLTVLMGLTVLFGVVAILLLDVNLTAPHRLYRDLLARTFIQSQDDKPDAVPLEQINSGNFAPYHLINATANLPSSANIALRERRSDFFLFSKFWCGAPSIGYTETSRWRAGDQPLDLATAMAVSGAAASSHMGLGSISSLRALLTVLNIRLGYWIRRPGACGIFKAPGFLCLVREMLGVAMSETQAWINLSDGGHIENMGVYELIRRRCKFIISVDGEADPDSTFKGHLTLVRHAQIDFGVRIDPDLTGLRPDLISRFSQSHAMLCRVHYPAAGGRPAGIGLILYMKLSVTGNELELIKRYRSVNPDFPHQTTLDQFFDEEQFEVYRQLGVHIAEGLFDSALIGTEPPPASVKHWFARLARNLLMPER